MIKSNFSLAFKDDSLFKLVNKTDKRILALWAIDCVERVMPFFEEKFPEDLRPRTALKVLRKWIDSGIFSMKAIRKASLDSHAAARKVIEDNSAKSSARAAGQAVATAHVKTHSLAAANYVLQAIYRNSIPDKAEAEIKKERKWQFKRLKELRKKFS